jgi:hypothetical protein
MLSCITLTLLSQGHRVILQRRKEPLHNDRNQDLTTIRMQSYSSQGASKKRERERKRKRERER